RATAAESLREPPFSGWLLAEEAAAKRLQLPDASGLDDPDRLIPHWFVLHAVADHEFDLRLAAGVDHLAAFGARDRHWLLAQHMLSRLRAADGVLGVHAVRQPHIDGVDFRIVADLVECL